MFPSGMSEDVSRNAPRYVYEIQRVLLGHSVPVGAESAMFAVADGTKTDAGLRADLSLAVRRIMDSEGGQISADELLSLILMASACPVNRLPSPKMEKAMYETLGFILEARRPVENAALEMLPLGLADSSEVPVELAAEAPVDAAVDSPVEAPVSAWQPRILAGALEEIAPERRRVMPVVALGALAACLFAGVAFYRHHQPTGSAQHDQPSALEQSSEVATRDEGVVRGHSQQAAVRPKSTPESNHDQVRHETRVVRDADEAVGGSRAEATNVAPMRAPIRSTGGVSYPVTTTISPREGVSHPPSATVAAKSSVAPAIAAAPTNSAGRSVAASAQRELVHSGSAGIMAANLISSPTPAYPKAASAAQVEGEVTVNALVGKDGNVMQATVVSGPPLLREAALRAVERWQYQPYLVSGKPTVVATTAIIEFQLGRD